MYHLALIEIYLRVKPLDGKRMILISSAFFLLQTKLFICLS